MEAVRLSRVGEGQGPEVGAECSGFFGFYSKRGGHLGLGICKALNPHRPTLHTALCDTLPGCNVA